MNYSCEVIQDLMPLYLDGVCSAQSRTAVEQHLRECPDCKDFWTRCAKPTQWKQRASMRKKNVKGQLRSRLSKEVCADGRCLPPRLRWYCRQQRH